MTVHDDLATLRHALTSFAFNRDESLQALARVEAEIARLEDAWYRTGIEYRLQKNRAEAAEVEVARLRARLDAAHRYRESQEGLPPGTLSSALADQDADDRALRELNERERNRTDPPDGAA